LRFWNYFARRAVALSFFRLAAQRYWLCSCCFQQVADQTVLPPLGLGNFEI
jgi:hypothetical protein